MYEFYSCFAAALSWRGRPLFKYLIAMKVLTVILMVFCLKVSATVYGQTISLSVKNEPIAKVFKQVQKQSGYLFWYKNTSLNKAATVTLAIKNATLNEALDKILSDQPLTYQIVDRTIVISPKAKPVQETTRREIKLINVNGKVTDENDKPLPGASVRVKGTDKVAITNSEGDYSLSNVDENAVLQVSFIGYTTFEIPVSSSAIAVIKLNPLVSKLNEVIVSTGFQDIPKERATGSFSKVDNATYNRQVSTDVISRLKGIAPSLNFDQRSQNHTYLSIRGRSTIYGNDQPLIVVDNFPYDGDLNNLNPNDIQDVSILKDAAAASIWGVRAGNGVIVITTRKGRINQPMRVDFSSNITLGEKPNLYYQSQMNPSDFIDIEKMLFDKGYYNSIIANTATSPPISPVVDILLQQRNGTISVNQANTQIDELRHYDLRNDLTKYFYQQTLNQQYALNLSGGSAKHIFYLSTSFDKNRLSQVGSGFDRVAVSTNQTFRPLKNLEISTGLFYNQNNSENNTALSTFNTMGDGRNLYPYARLADDNGNPLSVTKDFRNTFKTSAAQQGFLDWTLTPINELKLPSATTSTNSTRLNTGINYKIFPGLSADVKFQYQRQNYQGTLSRSVDSYYMRDLINRYTSISGGTLTRNIPLGGSLLNNYNTMNSLNGRGQLNFDHTWNKHQVSAIGGVEVREVNTNGTTGLIYGYDPLLGTSQAVNYTSTFPLYPSGSAASIPRGDDISSTVDRFRSYYFNASYSYDEKYTITGSGRIDQSNLFGVKANQRAVPLWSAGIKWDVSKEKFYNISWLSQLSVRSSLGYTGNLDNSITAFTTAVQTRSQLFPQPAARIATPPNEDLKWERSRIFNIGIDFGLKNNRLSGSIEYFSRKGSDLIGTGSIDPTTGFSSYTGNIAGMQGHGVDIEIASQNITLKNFLWKTNLLFSYAIDRITDYQLIPTVNLLLADNSLDRVSAGYTPVVGKPLFSIYSNPWAGLDPQTGAPRGYLNGEPSTNFSAINAKIAADPINGLIYDGPAIAPYFGSFRNTFTVHSFEASINITYRFGYYFRRPSISNTALYSSYSTNADYYSRWQKPGDETSTNVPAVIYPANAAADSYYTQSEVLVEKGDHIRLQDATISYSFNKTLLTRLHLQQLKIFAYANNLGIIWRANKKGIDPDYPTLPPVKTIAFGVNCSF